MYAKAGLGGGEVRDRRYGSTGIRASQRSLWDGEVDTNLLTTFAIAAMHLPSFLLIPHNSIIRIVQPIVCIRVDLKLSIDCVRLEPRTEVQKGGCPMSRVLHSLCQFVPTTPFELHICV